MRGEEIIQEALRQLKRQTGVSANVVPLRILTQNGEFTIDNRVQLNYYSKPIEFAVLVKNEIRKVHLPGILELIARRKDENWLVISQYIPKPLKQELKNQGINYLEASGNCFIRNEGLYLFVNDQAVTPVRLREQGKLWNPTGLKFLMVILQDPEMLNSSHRTLAKASGIALGNIGSFFDELKKEGYITTYTSGALRIENKTQLQNKWVELFTSILRPKLKLGTFRSFDNIYSNWKYEPQKDFLWGGEPAGDLLTGYLNPEKITLYTKKSKIEMMKELRLIPDVDGAIEVMEIFWNEQELRHQGKNQHTVPPLLAYAELATSLDSRNREIAERIKKEYLENE